MPVQSVACCTHAKIPAAHSMHPHLRWEQLAASAAHPHTRSCLGRILQKDKNTKKYRESMRVMQKGMDSKPVTKGTIPVCHQGTTHRKRVCGCAYMLEAPERGLAPCSSVPFAECAPCLRELFRPLPRAGVRVYKCIRADHAQRQCSSFHELRATCRAACDCCVFGGDACIREHSTGL